MNNFKNILVIVESIDINDSSGTKGRVALINNLKKAGFNLKVYHYTQKEIELKGIHCIQIKELKWTMYYLLSRIQRVFTRITKINVNSYIERWLGFSFIFFNDVNSIEKALKKENEFEFDWVLTLSKAASFRPHKALLKFPKWHSKWLAYVHDPYPMHSYPRPYDWVEQGHQFKRNFFIDVTEKAKYLMYPSKLLAEWMESYYPLAQGKSIIVPHQIDESSIINANSTSLNFNFDYFNLVHAGNMMSARNPKALIDAFELFLEENPKAKQHSNLYFIGGSSIYDDYIKEKQLPQLYLSDRYLPFEEVLYIQQNASVNIVLEAKGPISPFLPGKFPHCIQANRPILLLGPYYSESKRLLGEKYPYWSEINDVNSIKNKIEIIYQNWPNENISKDIDYSELNEYLSYNFLKEVIIQLKK